MLQFRFLASIFIDFRTIILEIKYAEGLKDRHVL